MKKIFLLSILLFGCLNPTVSSTTQRLGETPLYYEPVSYGAVSNDGQMDRAAFQQALDDASLGGTVFIGPGFWEFDRAPNGSYNNKAAISTHGRDITIR